MLLQNIRARIGARLNGDSEGGFTLIELLVVMLILGILAAIALPAFFNQRDKANDAEAKSTAHSAQVAMETCATDNSGQYTNCGTTALRAIEPTLPSTGLTVTAGEKTYTIAVSSTGGGGTFSVVRAENGGITYTCTGKGKGGCPSSGSWDS